MLRSNTLPAALATTAAALALAAPAPAATTTKTARLSGGTTTLTLSASSVANLQAAGVTMAGLAPATTTGNVLRFPVASGTVKVKGKKIVSGTVVHKGKLAMTREAVQLVLSKPTVVFGAKPVLNGTLGAVAVPVGTIDLSKAKVSLTKTALRVPGSR